MRRFIRPWHSLLLPVVVILMVVALPLTLSIVHSQATHAATPKAVTLPSMKLPWDSSLASIALTGGPSGHYPDKTCALANKSLMSGVDFGLPQNTNALAVAAGRVIYAGYTDSQIRNEVRIDHGGGFVTEYWDLNSIDPSIVVGASVAQGALLGKSGYAPCPNCKKGISVHLRLQFRQYTSNPLHNIPLSAHGLSMDGYRIWTFLDPMTGRGYQFQGTMTRGKTIIKSQSECGVNGVKTWYSLNGPTVLAIANGTGGYLTSPNPDHVNTDWPMFGFDAQHTQFNPYENVISPSNVSSLVLDWQYNMGGSTTAVVVNGVAYATSYSGNFVYALNAATGAYLWSYPITSETSLAVANGVVFVGSTDSKLYALNATSGAYLWSYSTGSGIYSSPAVVNGVVYISSEDDTFYALNATTGIHLWSYSTRYFNVSFSPAVVHGVVYVGTDTYRFAFHLLNADLKPTSTSKK